MMKPLDPFNLDLEKITLIEASAGTGKTYTITTLVARLVALGFPIESILVVTFTEAAAAELKLRIRQRLSDCLAEPWPVEPGAFLHSGQSDQAGEFLKDELARFFNDQPDPVLVRRRLAHGVACFDQACIMTIHSFCFQTLKENAFESGAYFDMELLADSARFFDQVCMDFFMTRINDLDPLLLKFLAQKAVTPEAFKSGFRQVVTRPGLDIIPPKAAFKDVSDAYRELTQDIYEMLKTDTEAIIGLIQDHKGVDKRSYTKKNLPNWLALSKETLAAQGRDALFVMTEKGDPLFKFTRTRLANKTKQGQTPPSHEFFDLCEALLKVSQVMETNLVSLKLAFFAYFHQKLERMKQGEGTCFFDDLINDLAAALDGENSEQLRRAVTKKYRACLIDEFQDTDPAQYQIFSRIFAGPGLENAQQQMPFFMIGDPKQAIYAFRGGDIFAYLSASKQSDQMFTLEKNYRSAPLMVAAVNDLFSLQETPFLFEQIEFTRVKTPENAVNRLVETGKTLPPLEFSFVSRDGFALDSKGYIKKEEAQKKIPRLLAADILSILNSDKRLLAGESEAAFPRKITPGDMAVLVRTNSQAESVHQALSELNLPSYLSKTGSVFDSREAIEIYDILTAVHEPDHLGHLKAALSSSVFGFTGEMLADLDRDDGQLWKQQDQFRGFKEIWEKKGFVSMIMVLFHSDDGALRTSSEISERGLTNFYHLIELISQAAQQHNLSMFYLLNWVREQLFVSTRTEQSDELRLESDKKAVAIVTIHKSKGLEYPIVFLPYLWDGGGKLRDPILFHDPDKNFQLRLDLTPAGMDRELAGELFWEGKPGHDPDRSRECLSFEQRAEEKRLLYVALTRASAYCKILWGGISSVEGSALGELLHPGGCKTDEEMATDLENLCRQGEKRVAIQQIFLDHDLCEPYTPMDLHRTDLAARSRKRHILPAWRISSFSALTRSEYDPDRYETDKFEPDSDERVLPQPAQGGEGINREIRLKTFPKGAGSGDFFHAIFEDLDFQDAGSVEEVVNKHLVKFGFKGQAYGDAALAAVRDILATPLDPDPAKGGGSRAGDPFCLEDILLGQRFTELEFYFDVNTLDLGRLGSLFAGEPDGKSYAAHLSALGATPFKGFIKGFIDLVIEHRGKWYILDYKSNFLGTRYGDYDRGAMQDAMESHHYILQYHLYLVALHRYLGLRLKNYSYDRDFGGVFYLFIRGMHPNKGNHGVFFDRPSKAFIDRFLAIL